MNLLIQLLPYALFAVLTALATGMYVIRHNQDRRRAKNGIAVAKTLAEPALKPAGDPVGQKTPVISSTAKPTSRAAQVLRLHELGITESHIGAALEMPTQEVEIVVRMDQARRAHPVSHEIGQPIS